MQNNLISALFIALLFSTNVHADFVRVEAGTGAWINQLDGNISSNPGGEINADNLGTDTETKGYAWIYIKHPVPVIPNVRLEYVNLSFSGSAKQEFTFKGDTYGVNADSTLDMTQYDVIAYYNLLDNTFWTTFDLGIDVKIMDFDFTATSTTNKLSESESLFLPMAYTRVRAELPTTNIGIEVNAKYISYSGDSFMDYSFKIDYTLLELLAVDLAIELGYRKQELKIDGNNYGVDLSIDGFFAGLAIKF
ncbi:MAG: TIGR04219 family outer membrane beta-barrel protein [Gammaproteobacteria bacterium]|nr:TIGR04219 family outer membrane beta-barrel protein [Gammaproteobacteria bacterium]